MRSGCQNWAGPALPLPPVCWINYLEFCQLLHKLFLLFAVGEWRQDIQEDFKKVQTLSRHTGQCEYRRDTVERQMCKNSLNRKQ